MSGLRTAGPDAYAWFTDAVLCVVFVALLLAAASAGCGADADDSARPPSVTPSHRLIAAAYANDVSAARRLVAQGADVNAKDGTRQSAFLIATSEVGDDPSLLELTLDHGAAVNDKDRYDGTGLIRAAERGYPSIVRRLLQTDIAVDHVNRLGWTALLEAIILGEGRDPHIETVRALVEGGVDVDVPDSEGVTPLAHAEKRGHGEIAEILRTAGARRSLEEEPPAPRRASGGP